MKKLSKLITWPLVFIFLYQNMGWSVPAPQLSTINHQLSTIFIPEQYGRIEKTNRQTGKQANGQTVVLIKDAHCNYEAQTNIAKILDILIRDYKIELVGEEGASGHINPSIVLESNPKEEDRKDVSDKFLKNGLLVASEALSINKGKEPGFTIWGIEDLRLYLKDYKAFRDTFGTNSTGKHFIELLSKTIDQLKKRIYPEELQGFDSFVKGYESNEIPLSRFIKVLYYNHGIPKNYKNLKLILKSIRLEEEIDFNNVERERTGLIRKLEKALTKEDLQELIKQSLLYKLGKIPASEYYKYLEPHTTGVRTQAKNLIKYIRLVKLQDKLDETGLFRELAALLEDIYTALCIDKTSLILHQLDKDIGILNKIFRLEATRENMAYYKENQIRFKPGNLLQFIKIQAPLNNINLAPELNDPSFIEDVNNAITPAGEFYRLAVERDTALVENLLGVMQRNRKDKAVLVCGGFHAEGIKKILEDKGVSILTITPSITKLQEDSNEIYLRRMMDERIDPERMLAELGMETLRPPIATGPEGRRLRLPQPVIDALRGRELKQLTRVELLKILHVLKEFYKKGSDTYDSWLEDTIGEINRSLPEADRIVLEESTVDTILVQVSDERFFVTEIIPDIEPGQLWDRLRNILTNLEITRQNWYWNHLTLKAKISVARRIIRLIDISEELSRKYFHLRDDSSIISFGSMLWGEGESPSDIDLLVIHHGEAVGKISTFPLETIRKAIAAGYSRFPDNYPKNIQPMSVNVDTLGGDYRALWTDTSRFEQFGTGISTWGKIYDRFNTPVSDYMANLHQLNRAIARNISILQDPAQSTEKVKYANRKILRRFIESCIIFAEITDQLAERFGRDKIQDRFRDHLSLSHKVIEIYNENINNTMEEMYKRITRLFSEEALTPAQRNHQVWENAHTAVVGMHSQAKNFVEEQESPDPSALKAPGGDPLDEDDQGAMHVRSIINNPNIPSRTVEIKGGIYAGARIHVLDLGSKLGIPRKKDATAAKDMVFALGMNEAGRLGVYVTEAFWKNYLEKDALMLNFLLDHESMENIQGRTHREASQRAWKFLDGTGMNPFYRFYIDQLVREGDLETLERLTGRHLNDPDGRFRRYVQDAIPGRRTTAEIGILNRLLTEGFRGVAPRITNLYIDQPRSGVGEVVDTFVSVGRKNGADVRRLSQRLDSVANYIANRIRLGLQGEDVGIPESGWQGYKEFNEKIAGQIELNNTNVLILHNHELLGAVPVLKERYPNLRIIWNCHLDLDNFRPEIWNRLRDYVNRCDLVILQPRDTKERFHERLGINVPVVFSPPSTIDPLGRKHRALTVEDKAMARDRLKEYGIPDIEEVPYFLYTGRLIPQKGIVETIKAFKEMKKGLPAGKKTRLIIATHEEDMNNDTHTEVLNELEYDADGIYLLFIKEEDQALLTNYLQTNTLCGLLLSSREGFGLPAAETMYKARPVIGTDVGGIKTQIVNAVTGYLVRPGNRMISSAAAYMKRLVLDREEADRLGANAGRLARERYLAGNLVMNYLYAVQAVMRGEAMPTTSAPVTRFIEYARAENMLDAIRILGEELDRMLQAGLENTDECNTLLEYFEAIEHMIYEMMTEGGRASYLVLERLKNMMWQMYRQNRWDDRTDIFCINLPIAAINTAFGMDTADALKERFFEAVKKYMRSRSLDPILRYEKGQEGYYGYSKTRMYIVGLGTSDIPHILRLYEESLSAIGIPKEDTAGFPIYIGHKEVSLARHKKALSRITDPSAKDSFVEEIILRSVQEALGMAEYIEKKKPADRYSMSERDWISLLPWVKRTIRYLGRKKFIPEGEYRTGKFPRIRHMIGRLEITRKSILTGDKSKMRENGIRYIILLRRTFDRALRDIRYVDSFKREYIKTILKNWDRISSSNRLMTKAGDELWFYRRTEAGIEVRFGELDKFNAFNEAYEAVPGDSLYHQVIEYLRMFVYSFGRADTDMADIEVTIPDTAPYNSKKGYEVHTEAARVKGRWFKTRLVRPQHIVTIRGGNTYRLGELPFHSKEKVMIDGRIRRLELYEMENKKTGEKRRFVVHNYRIYTATGKKDEDEEDITEDVLSRRGGYIFSPVVATLGVTLTTDRANLTNLRQDAISNLNAYQKKTMKIRVQDVSEITAHQIISILEREGYKPQLSITGLAQIIIDVKEGKTGGTGFTELRGLLRRKGLGEDALFKIAAIISEPVDELLGEDSRAIGGRMIGAILNAILNSLPSVEEAERPEHAEIPLAKLISPDALAKRIIDTRDPAFAMFLLELLKAQIQKRPGEVRKAKEAIITNKLTAPGIIDLTKAHLVLPSAGEKQEEVDTIAQQVFDKLNKGEVWAAVNILDNALTGDSPVTPQTLLAVLENVLEHLEHLEHINPEYFNRFAFFISGTRRVRDIIMKNVNESSLTLLIRRDGPKYPGLLFKILRLIESPTIDAIHSWVPEIEGIKHLLEKRKDGEALTRIDRYMRGIDYPEDERRFTALLLNEVAGEFPDRKFNDTIYRILAISRVREIYDPEAYMELAVNVLCKREGKTTREMEGEIAGYRIQIGLLGLDMDQAKNYLGSYRDLPFKPNITFLSTSPDKTRFVPNGFEVYYGEELSLLINKKDLLVPYGITTSDLDADPNPNITVSYITSTLHTVVLLIEGTINGKGFRLVDKRHVGGLGFTIPSNAYNIYKGLAYKYPQIAGSILARQDAEFITPLSRDSQLVAHHHTEEYLPGNSLFNLRGTLKDNNLRLANSLAAASYYILYRYLAEGKWFLWDATPSNAMLETDSTGMPIGPARIVDLEARIDTPGLVEGSMDEFFTTLLENRMFSRNDIELGIRLVNEFIDPETRELNISVFNRNAVNRLNSILLGEAMEHIIPAQIAPAPVAPRPGQPAVSGEIIPAKPAVPAVVQLTENDYLYARAYADTIARLFKAGQVLEAGGELTSSIKKKEIPKEILPFVLDTALKKTYVHSRDLFKTTAFILSGHEDLKEIIKGLQKYQEYKDKYSHFGSLVDYILNPSHLSSDKRLNIMDQILEAAAKDKQDDMTILMERYLGGIQDPQRVRRYLALLLFSLDFKNPKLKGLIYSILSMPHTKEIFPASSYIELIVEVMARVENTEKGEIQKALTGMSKVYRRLSRYYDIFRRLGLTQGMIEDYFSSKARSSINAEIILDPAYPVEKLKMAGYNTPRDFINEFTTQINNGEFRKRCLPPSISSIPLDNARITIRHVDISKHTLISRVEVAVGRRTHIFAYKKTFAAFNNAILSDIDGTYQGLRMDRDIAPEYLAVLSEYYGEWFSPKTAGDRLLGYSRTEEYLEGMTLSEIGKRFKSYSDEAVLAEAFCVAGYYILFDKIAKRRWFLSDATPSNIMLVPTEDGLTCKLFDIEARVDLPERIGDEYFITWLRNRRFRPDQIRKGIELARSFGREGFNLSGHKTEVVKKLIATIKSAQIKPIPIETHFTDAGRVVAIPDVHGDLEGLRAALLEEGLIEIIDIDDHTRDKWKGGTLVQLGDIFDRGRYDVEAFEYLLGLQKKAKAEEKGEVIILLGNHELAYIREQVITGTRLYKAQRKIEKARKERKKASKRLEQVLKRETRPDKIADAENEYNRLKAIYDAAVLELRSAEADYMKRREQLVKAVQDGNIKAMHTMGNTIFVHGGIKRRMYYLLRKEISSRLNKPITDVTIKDLAEHCNQLLVEAVTNSDFTHPIFHMGKKGLGYSADTGIFWARFQKRFWNVLLKVVEEIPGIRQVVGHTPVKGIQRYGEGKGIVHLDQLEGRAHLVFEPGGEIMGVLMPDEGPLERMTIDRTVSQGPIAHFEGLKLKTGGDMRWRWMPIEDKNIQDVKDTVKVESTSLGEIEGKPVWIDNGILYRFNEFGFSSQGGFEAFLKEFLSEQFRLLPPAGKEIVIALLQQSQYLFEDCQGNGFIGINKQIFSESITPESRVKLLKLGLRHELRHESLKYEKQVLKARFKDGDIDSLSPDEIVQLVKSYMDEVEYASSQDDLIYAHGLGITNLDTLDILLISDMSLVETELFNELQRSGITADLLREYIIALRDSHPLTSEYIHKYGTIMSIITNLTLFLTPRRLDLQRILGKMPGAVAGKTGGVVDIDGTFFSYEKISKFIKSRTLGFQVGIEMYLRLDPEGQREVERLLNENDKRRLRIGLFLRDKTALNIRTGLYTRGEIDINELQRKVFRIGTQNNIEAHGVSAGKGGLNTMLLIMLDGIIGGLRPGTGPLADGSPEWTAGPHGPFYIILDPDVEDWRKTENHIAYLVPEEADKDLLTQELRNAVEKGLIGEAEAGKFIERIVTYSGFISRYNAVNEISRVIEGYGVRMDNAKKEGLVKALSEAYKDDVQIDIPGLMSQLSQRIAPEKAFQLTAEIAGPINRLLGPEALDKAGKMVAAILKEILELIPISIETEEEKLLKAIKAAAVKKGIDPNTMQSIFDLIRDGLGILTAEPASKLDSNYFTLIGQIERLTGIDDKKIIKAFGAPGLARERLAEVPDSPLVQEVEKLGLYLELNNMPTRSDLDLGMERRRGLFYLDSLSARIKRENNGDIHFLSSVDAVNKDMAKAYREAQASPGGSIIDRKEKITLVVSADTLISIKRDGKFLRFSYKPGIQALLRILANSRNIHIVIRADEEARQVLEEAGILNEQVTVEDTEKKTLEASMTDVALSDRPSSVVFLLTPKEGEENKDIIERENIKAFGLAPDSAFHAGLLFAVLYAQAQTPDEIVTAINTLKLLGMKPSEVDEIVQKIRDEGLSFFTVKLLRIKDTLGEFQNRRLYIEVAA